MKNIKICNISPQGYTGIAYYDYSFCRSLQDAGVEVHFVTSQKWLIENKQVNFILKPFFVNTYGERSRLIKGLNYITASLKTFFYVMKHRIPIVHYQLIELPVVDLFFFRLYKLFGIKIVYTPHDIYNFKFSLGVDTIRKFLDLSDRVLAHNSANIELFQLDFGLEQAKLRLIRQGNMNDFLHSEMTKEQARRQINLPLDKKIILVFGNIREGKGTETALKAFAALPDKTGALLLLAGKPMRGYDVSVIETVLASRGMAGHYEKRFQFIEDKDLEAYYKSVDIVLVSYEKIYTSAVFCFAFSCGGTVVVSDIPEFTDFARDGENCLVFKVGDAEDLALKMARLIADPGLCRKIGLGAKAYADQSWAWEETARTLKNIYQELI
jgi:glycosyltransferase involved in cell wall biosynthesis